MVERGRPQMAIWRMSVACWIPKATNTHSQYVIRTAVPLQELSLERTALLRYSRLRVLVCTEENLYSADRVWFVYCTGSFVERFSCIVFTRTVRLQGWKVTVEPTGHYMYRTVVTICTVSLTFNNSTFCPHSVFMCFVWI